MIELGVNLFFRFIIGETPSTSEWNALDYDGPMTNVFVPSFPQTIDGSYGAHGSVPGQHITTNNQGFAARLKIINNCT